MNPHFPRLFSPLTLAGRQLKNRIVFPAVVSLYAREHLITPRWMDYYAERAKGGAAMLVTEGLSVHESSSPQPGVVTLFDNRNDELLRQAAHAVEQHDCRFIGQLWHVGRQALWNPVAAPWGVSDLPDAYSWSVPHVMSLDEIQILVGAYTGAAQRLQRAGFSGAELHGAHGYLIGQFLSPWSNTRTDDYGGGVEGRTRFVREVIAAIRVACGKNFIVGLKMPGDEGVADGIDGQEALRLAQRIARDDTPDYLAFSQGNFSLSLENHVPDMHFPPGPFMPLIKDLRLGLPGIPVMAMGRIVDAAHAEKILEDGGGDLIGLARALIADAALPRKAARGETVRPCVFSNVCWGEIHGGKAMACLHNPELAQHDEASFLPPRTAKCKKVAVVGAGVAGLQAAWVLAARGHDVTLFGSVSPGGKARLEANLPGRAEIAKVYEYQLLRVREHQVKFELGVHADFAMLERLAPQAVVLATGSYMRVPDSLQTGAQRAMSVRDYADRTPQPTDEFRNAVLFDQDHTQATYAVADQLAGRFQKLTIVTPRTQLGRSVPYVNLIGIYRRLHQTRVEILNAHLPVSYNGEEVTVRNVFNGDQTVLGGVALFAYATPRIAHSPLASRLREAGIETYLVGDCFAPRNMMAAIHEAHERALRI
ncbi:MAG: FAD-dependent oxidoreductase [Burkholderiales bacterium]